MNRSKAQTRTKRKTTSDALEIMKHRYIRPDPEMSLLVEQERASAEIGRKIYDLRTKAGLSQRKLAALVGTTASVICRLEDADYDGHSVSMLQRIAAALDRRVEIRFVPARKEKRSA